MANRLKMAEIQAILSLKSRGWSNRRMASELGVDRATVARYVKLAIELAKPSTAPAGEPAGEAAPNPASAPPGAVGPDAPKPANAPAGNDQTEAPNAANAPPGMDRPEGSKPTSAPPGVDGAEAPNAAKAPPGISGEQPAKSANLLTGAEWSELAKKLDEIAWRIQPLDGRRHSSRCEPYRETIEEKLAIGLSGQRIYQDLREEGFQGSVYSVQRFVRKLLAKTPEAFRRLECLPGEEAQIDFGKGASIVDGKRKRRTHVFRIVLSHSRKAYSEAVYQQTTESFLRCLENAFWYFGGVPKTLIPDNLKAAVQTPDWFDPEINPKLQSFCAHYGTVVLPTKPRTPRHEGKVESGVGYVQGNGLKGRTFNSLEEQNRYLLQWEQGVADRRIHGTTKRQVAPYFEEVERAALIPLPTDRFPFFHEAQRSVHRDGHIEVAKAYYSVPPEYVGRLVWARWDERIVRVFNGRMEQIALDARQEPGRHATARQHLSDHKIAMVEEGAESLLMRAARIGPKTKQWAETMFEARGIEGVRVLVGLVSLARKHQAKDIELACDTALTYGAYRLRTIRQLIGKHAPKQQTLEFLDEHPIIRRLEDYGALVRDVSNKEVSQ
jgi:transposase